MLIWLSHLSCFWHHSTTFLSASYCGGSSKVIIPPPFLSLYHRIAGEGKGDFFSDVAALPQWCYGFAIVMYCAFGAKWCDVSAFSRAKRTSLAKQTSRPKGTSRSANTKGTLARALCVVMCVRFRCKTVCGWFRCMAVLQRVQYPLGDDGSCTWPLSSGAQRHACKRSLCILNVFYKLVKTSF